MTDRLVFTPTADLDAVPRRDLGQDDRFDVVETFELVRAAPVAPVRPRMVSSAHGPISHVMLWYPPGTSEAPPYQAIYQQLMRDLPATTLITLVVHPDSASAAEKLAGARSGVEIITTPEWLAFSVWAEDACVVVEDVGVDPPITYLVEPFEFPRRGDQIVADLVAQATPLQSTQLPLMFQGGNILIADSFTLIGRDYLDESVAAAHELGSIEGFPRAAGQAEQEQFIGALFRSTFDADREIHFLDSAPQQRPGNHLVTHPNGQVSLDVVTAGIGRRQPIFHIDMFVSLAGREAGAEAYRVLVGDPGYADRLLGWDPVGHELQAEFDAVAAQLEGLGFDVRRTPLPYIPAVVGGAGSVTVDGEVVRFDLQRRWYHATSNNCLVQIEDTTRDVWLPTYGHGDSAALSVVDDEHERIWTELGFTVHRLGDFHHFAINLGALHCIKKFLAR